MIRRTLKRTLNPIARARSAREHARGIRSDVALPFDMFDAVRDARELTSARKLEGIYHKGQQRAWNGKEVLPELIAKHGGIHLPAEKAHALSQVFAVILWGELAAWKISAQLATHLEPLEAKMAATSQAHDEARHFYTMHDYLEELHEVPTDLGPATTRVLTGTLRANTLTKKLIGMQLMIEPMALTLFQTVRRRRLEPVLSDLLALYERDEARHVALGVLHLPKLLTQMTRGEAMDLWAWEFGEFWHQFSMLRELEPHLRELDIDPAEIVKVARNKQIKANLMLFDELGYDIAVKDWMMRFFDAKIEWNFSSKGRNRPRTERAADAFRAAFAGIREVDEELSYVPA